MGKCDHGNCRIFPPSAKCTSIQSNNPCDWFFNCKHRFAFDHAGLLHSLGKSEEAIAVLDGLIQEEPDAADAYLSKAVLLSSLSRWDAALSSLKQAEETLRPDDRQSETDDPLERILRLRVEGLVALGRTDEAQALRDELPRLLAQKPADLTSEQP